MLVIKNEFERMQEISPCCFGGLLIGNRVLIGNLLDLSIALVDLLSNQLAVHVEKEGFTVPHPMFVVKKLALKLAVSEVLPDDAVWNVPGPTLEASSVKANLRDLTVIMVDYALRKCSTIPFDERNFGSHFRHEGIIPNDRGGELKV
jgi:hypothetical protein